MDNFTHSVVGLGVGELIQRSLAAETVQADQRTRRRLLLVACVAASNFPDLDLIATSLLPAPLGYLLHHRGHTHTLLLALPQALLLVALLWLLWPAARTLLRHSAPARAGLALTVVLGFALHLGMDYLNSYGLHPFAPFDGRWLYGDTLFIIEPVFWIAFGVPLAMTLARRSLKTLFLGGLAIVLAICALRGFLVIGAGMVLLGLGAVLAAMQYRDGARGRSALMTGLAIGVGFVALQGYASALGKQRIAAELRQIDPAARLLDIAMTPFPSDPLCWSFVAVEREDAQGRYRLRRGLLSLLPRQFPVATCPAALTRLAPAAQTLLAMPAAAQSGITLQGEAQGSLANLRSLAAGNCYFAAWMRFARMPLMEGDTATDWRFATSVGYNFSTVQLAATEDRACRFYVPPWGTPRADLLAPSS
jgi:inner membrane protein